MTPTILIIDPDHEVARETGDYLARMLPCEIVHFADPLDATHYIREHHVKVTVAVIELVMAHRNGLEIITELNAHYPHIVIVATCWKDGLVGKFDYLPVAQLLGASATLAKPFTPRQVFDTVAMLLVAEAEVGDGGRRRAPILTLSSKLRAV